MAAVAMSRGLALRVLLEHARRRRRARALDLHRLTFGPQRAFVFDAAPFVAASCSRQAGKSYGLGLKLIDTASRFHKSRMPCLYLTNTRPQARQIMWPVLHELDEALHLGGKFNETRLIYTLPNGGAVQLGGANDEVEIERYRGPQYPLVVIDEAQSVRPFISRLIFQIIRPGQAKYGQAAQIMVTGTPNASRAGFLYDVVTGKEEGWSVHHWTIFDNEPMARMTDVDWFVDDTLSRRGLTRKDAAAQREFFGQWVRDASSQVYKVRKENLVDALPEADDWRHVIGIDFGFANVTAFCVVAYSVALGRIVVVESWQERVVDADDEADAKTQAIVPPRVAEILRGLRARYPRTVAIVGDPGSLGAEWIDQLRVRYEIPISAAEKHKKASAVELMNGDLRTGRMLVVKPANEDLLHDAANLQYLWDRVDDRKHGGNVDRFDLLIDTSVPDHLTDAWTYAYRECWHFLHRDLDELERQPPPGSPAAEAREEQEREDAELEAIESGSWLEGDEPLGAGGFGF